MSFFDITVLSVPLYELVFAFFFYSMCGFIAEVFYAALVLGKFVNRGFLAGPYCPIYGLAVACVDMALSPLTGHPLLVFIGGIIVIDTIEYFGGLLLFKLFRQRWWDYTEEPFNIGGFICLSFSLVWGFFSLVVIYILIPITRMIIDILPHMVIGIFCLGMTAYMTADIIVTVLTVIKFNKKLEQIDRITNLIRKNSDIIGKSVSDRTLAAAEAVDLKGKTEEFNRFKESIPDPREAGVKETADAIRDGLKEELIDKYFPDAKERLEETVSRLTSGERRILNNLPDSARSVYRDTLARLRDITGAVDISGIKKKFTSLFSSGNALLHIPKISENAESIAKLAWIFVIGSVGGIIFECAMAIAAGYPASISLSLSPVYGLSAAALTMAIWKLRSLRIKGYTAIFTVSALYGAALQSLCVRISGILSPETGMLRQPLTISSGFASAVFFGVIGVIWIKLLLPLLLSASEKLMAKNRIAAAAIPLSDAVLLIIAALAAMR